MTEWLDLHPQILKALNDDPEMVNLIERYADQLKPFLARYNGTKAAESASTATPPEPQTPAEPDAAMKANLDALTTLLEESRKEQERLAGELAGTVANRDALKAELDTRINERDESVAQLNEACKREQAAVSERDEAVRKLKAMEAGAPPLSALPAPSDESLTPWQKAQKAQKR